MSGNFLGKESSIRQAPFLLFLTLIGLIYIANSYFAERKVRDIATITKELKELRAEYITGKSQLMFVTRQSEIGLIADEMGIGIKPSLNAPGKIMMNQEEEKK
jgi:hypothetical protein